MGRLLREEIKGKIILPLYSSGGPYSTGAQPRLGGNAGAFTNECGREPLLGFA